jgi:hypothetical protein
MPYLQVSNPLNDAPLLSQASMLTIAGRGRSNVTSSSQHATAVFRRVVFVTGMASGAVAVTATPSATPNRHTHRLSNAPPQSPSRRLTASRLALPFQTPVSVHIWIGFRIKLRTSYLVSSVPGFGIRLSSRPLSPSQLYCMQYSPSAAHTEAHHPLVSTRLCQAMVALTNTSSSVCDNTARRYLI